MIEARIGNGEETGNLEIRRTPAAGSQQVVAHRRTHVRREQRHGDNEVRCACLAPRRIATILMSSAFEVE